MKVAEAFAASGLDDIKAALAGGTLTVYSVARPLTANLPVDRSGVLAVFRFSSPAFGAPVDGGEAPVFVEETATAESVGTPGFARACSADGAVVADFSAGPGNREIKFAEVSCSKDAPVKVVSFQIQEEDGWPERPDYFDSRPRPGYQMPSTL
ncbi:hypothetical protein [Roseibium marinum]|uniref:Uncharacterized protein n=1 Tax=Roseibium marinum TaxID=281252 RepID=A0A2S3V1K9_9HYPH|nr:hypothetical protein [Roseibium marinum]POF33846.1 hypothetical protein CLV41_101295 [Roseibium marinum]